MKKKNINLYHFFQQTDVNIQKEKKAKDYSNIQVNSFEETEMYLSNALNKLNELECNISSNHLKEMKAIGELHKETQKSIDNLTNQVKELNNKLSAQQTLRVSESRDKIIKSTECYLSSMHKDLESKHVSLINLISNFMEENRNMLPETSNYFDNLNKKRESDSQTSVNKKQKKHK